MGDRIWGKGAFWSPLFVMLSPVASLARPSHLTKAPPPALVRNNGSEITSLNPALAVNTADFSVLIDLFDTLTDITASGDVVPCAAESWKATTPTQWEFTLRPHMVWTNGDPVEAQDFVRGWRHLMDPKTASPYATMFTDTLLNGAQVVAGHKDPTQLGVMAKNSQTLVVTTPQPLPHLPAILAMRSFSPLHKKNTEGCGKTCFKSSEIITNGPYRIVSWEPNNKIKLTKHTKHWDTAHGTIPNVVYLPISDANTEFHMFQSGELHWTHGIPPSSFKNLQKTNPQELRTRLILGLEFYTFNTEHPRLKDPRVRKALSMAIDRSALTDKVIADGSQPTFALYPPGIQGLEVLQPFWAQWPMDKRVAEAKALLKSAGFKTKTPLEIVYDTNDTHKKVGQAVASQWKQHLGISVVLKNMERKVLNARKQSKDYVIARDGWVADFNDITTFLGLYTCSSTQNNSGICLPQDETFYTKALQTSSPQRRREFLGRFAKRVLEAQPTAPLYQHSLTRLVKEFVGGYSDTSYSDFSPTKYHYFVAPPGPAP